MLPPPQLVKYFNCQGSGDCAEACLLLMNTANPSDPTASDIGFLTFHTTNPTFDTCDRSNYPADPSDHSSWNAKCMDGAFMYGGGLDLSFGCDGGSGGSGDGGAECSVSDDVWLWRGLVLTTNKANCVHAAHCEEMYVPSWVARATLSLAPVSHARLCALCASQRAAGQGRREGLGHGPWR